MVNVTPHRDARRTRLKLGADTLLKQDLLCCRRKGLWHLFRRRLGLLWLRLSNGEAELGSDQ